jgi:hypothetical protein
MFENERNKKHNKYNNNDVNPRAFFVEIADRKIDYTPQSQPNYSHHDPLELELYCFHRFQSMEDFKTTLIAPLAMPVVCLAIATKLLGETLKHFSLGVLKLSVLIFNNDEPLFSKSLKQACSTLYYAVSAIIDALTAAVTLLTRSLSTGVAVFKDTFFKPSPKRDLTSIPEASAVIGAPNK